MEIFFHVSMLKCIIKSRCKFSPPPTLSCFQNHNEKIISDKLLHLVIESLGSHCIYWAWKRHKALANKMASVHIQLLTKVEMSDSRPTFTVPFKHLQSSKVKVLACRKLGHLSTQGRQRGPGDQALDRDSKDGDAEVKRYQELTTRPRIRLCLFSSQFATTEGAVHLISGTLAPVHHHTQCYPN